MVCGISPIYGILEWKSRGENPNRFIGRILAVGTAV